MEHCAKEFKWKEDIDLFKDKDSNNKEDRDKVRQRLRRLQASCEEHKIDLSTAESTIFSVECIAVGKNLNVTVTRAQFEEMNASLFKKIFDIVTRVLESAKVDADKIEDIVLVGGSTRIPKVQKMLSKYFNGKALNHQIDADKCVAFGAAVKAALMNGGDTKKTFDFNNIQDVTPMSLGIKATTLILKESVAGPECIGLDCLATIIPKNTRIPTKLKEFFSTSFDGQTGVEIMVYQG